MPWFVKPDGFHSERQASDTASLPYLLSCPARRIAGGSPTDCDGKFRLWHSVQDIHVVAEFGAQDYFKAGRRGFKSALLGGSGFLRLWRIGCVQIVFKGMCAI